MDRVALTSRPFFCGLVMQYIKHCIWRARIMTNIGIGQDNFTEISGSSSAEEKRQTERYPWEGGCFCFRVVLSETTEICWLRTCILY